MSSIVCGSLAFDVIMLFDRRFADYILPDQLHRLDVSFLVPSLRRDFGGCAGNIAYGLKLLGGNPLIVGTLGTDGASYMQRFKNLDISTRYIREINNQHTAQAMIMTDQDGSQITAFHPGAMMYAHELVVPLASEASLGIISPDDPKAMRIHAEQLAKQKIAFIFDPGQNLPVFNESELASFIDMADWIVVNAYESNMLSARSGLALSEISYRVQGLIVTLGDQGSEVWQSGEKIHVAPIVPDCSDDALDAVGCGDAFRAALLYGLEKNWPLLRCAHLGNCLGAIKVAHKGPQNYNLDNLNRRQFDLS